MNMNTKHPDVTPGAGRTSHGFTPMKPPTYAEALGYILQTPRRLWSILEFFSPDEAERATRALYELYELGAVVHTDGLYRLADKRSAS